MENSDNTPPLRLFTIGRTVAFLLVVIVAWWLLYDVYLVRLHTKRSSEYVRKMVKPGAQWVPLEQQLLSEGYRFGEYHMGKSIEYSAYPPNFRHSKTLMLLYRLAHVIGQGQRLVHLVIFMGSPNVLVDEDGMVEQVRG